MKTDPSSALFYLLKKFSLLHLTWGYIIVFESPRLDPFQEQMIPVYIYIPNLFMIHPQVSLPWGLFSQASLQTL